MDPKTSITRFLYTGNIELFYYAKHKTIKLERVLLRPLISDQLKSIIEGPKVAHQLFDVVKRTLDSKTLIRKDEAIYFLVYCIRTFEDDKLREKIYASFPTLLSNPDDLFLFIHLYVNFDKDKKHGLSRGLRSAIIKWYSSKSTVELANMIRKRKMYFGFTHNDIFRLTHASFKDQDDKEKLVKASFTRVSKLKKNADQEILESPGVKRLIQLNELIQLTEPSEMIDYIKCNSISFDEIPLNMKKHVEIWNYFLPTFNYENLIGSVMMLHDFELLTPAHPFAKVFSFKMGDTQKVKKAKVHPIEFLSVSRLFAENSRYLCPAKEIYHTKKMLKLGLEPNPLLKGKITLAMNHSIGILPATGCNYYITIDLRKGSLSRTVYSMSHLKCMEVSLLLALCYLKREKDVILMSFTSEANILKKVELEKSMSFERALGIVDVVAEEKTEQNLSLPIEKATKDKKKVDVFITIVDSIGHATKGKSTAPTAALQNYRKVMKNNKARNVIINLSRRTKDLDIDQNTEGILEIVGFSNDTPKIIDAYAKNLFK